MTIVFPLKARTLLLDFQGHLHQGRGGANDFKANYVTVYSPVDGTILNFDESTGGHWIRITDSEGRHWEMAHLSKRVVRTGDVVKAGQHIATSGNSGTTTSGPHLHLQLIKNGQRLDPWPLLRNAPFPGEPMSYDNQIIRNQETGAFAYVKGGTGKKQIITEAKSGFATITFLDRSRPDKPLADQINTVPPNIWESFTNVPDGTWF